MTINYFTLTEGVLELHLDKLLIFENAKRDRFSILAVSICGLEYSLITTLRGYKDKDDSWFYFGIVPGIFWLFFLLTNKRKFQSVENEIY